MATLVLGAVGSMFGPLGGALGTLLGRTIDGRLFGSGAREGPRLKELTFSSSSYGTPISRHFGTMRTSGTIIWATDLVEHRQDQGGGKGQPRAVGYSYSVSFAVALASRPIDGIGRIWADGNLLRGQAGDLKTGGTLRVHRGFRDQLPDPLLKSALGAHCPAFRGTAYVVFEDLDLTDFGNRIPALSFEVMAGEGASMIGDLFPVAANPAADRASFPALTGFSHDGGSFSTVAASIDRLQPLDPVLDGETLRLLTHRSGPQTPVTLPPSSEWKDGEFGQQSGSSVAHGDPAGKPFTALRYYDVDRDYQPGLQATPGYTQDQRIFEFPGAFEARSARMLAREAQQRAAMQTQTLAWRCAEIDPAVVPGALVRVPGETGTWRVTAWEWREHHVELELERYRAPFSGTVSASPGAHWIPPDRAAAATKLRLVELPWDGNGSADQRRIFAAIAARPGRWAGAALYAVQSGALVSTGQTFSRMATTGRLEQPLAPSSCVRLEPDGSLMIRLDDPAENLPTTDVAGLAQGANRALIGSEIVQFLRADAVGEGVWRLTGLLRGRGGTERAAASLKASGTAFLLLDADVVPLSDNALAMATPEGFAALGPTDDEPSLAHVENAGTSLAPPEPVHAEMWKLSSGDLRLQWARRARGGWLWRGGVSQPLTEEKEAYEIGSGTATSPLIHRRTSTPYLHVQAAEIASFGPLENLWVRQVGTYAPSPPRLFSLRQPGTIKE